ncbi:hypothetical protein KIH41_17040 [Litoribacter ruber]|uniref:Uncharacterized protein n=1 Tax=Litoribacter ruber TaxID=702568 RepID=A0AAP2CJQ2_9BACT|nr:MULTISPECIES: hypothetical protein [Litoribacter]MBS9525963.1 hypothetical protein [Litoribacter alkaliphilus]MBT0812996.1 hypothetical protein [Litoribacter ruber]
MGRRVIHAQDIMEITGKGRTYAYDLLRKIKEFFKKLPHQVVTFEDYAEYHGVSLASLQGYMSK